ncbi:hypothetical protein SO802_032265 [Lithocarpus litseifolius]|uniref:Protein kinase domain-containing protein n=1 Tax=Lithocarpus litseifolius TaxID=425828 RepID=A0AAW2BQX1_9ROSI
MPRRYCSADIWSVGCTVIEMATGKPPWSQQYQEVAALFHIGTTKSHPPIPEHLSAEAKDFLLKCLQKEPDLRHVASDLLQHPFVTGDYWESHPLSTSVMATSLGVCMQNGLKKTEWGMQFSGGFCCKAEELVCEHVVIIKEESNYLHRWGSFQG